VVSVSQHELGPTSEAMEPGRGPPCPDRRGIPEDEYEYLQPLLDVYAATALADPCRAELRSRLVTGYLPVARHIARRYSHKGEPLDDLEQVACIGLIKAVDRFEPDQGRAFLPFAVPTITGEVRRHFRDKTWSMRVPRRLKDLHVAIHNVTVELSQQLGRAPRPSDIAGRLQISLEEVLSALQAGEAYHAGSLDEPLTSSGTATLQTTLGEPDPALDRFVRDYSLNPHLAALSTLERQILVMRFFEDMTQTQIAARIGVSQMQVSRLLSTILTALRTAIGMDGASAGAPAGTPDSGLTRRQGDSPSSGLTSGN
jgi:RNA polymerase sigma-B factor